jgi:hypothetical protein
MPFSSIAGISEKKWTETYEELFKPAIEDSRLGYVCERSEIRNGAFTKDIIENLKNASVVLADVTGLNPSVMWELGVRHTLSKRTIMLVRSDKAENRIISDMKIYGVVSYNPNSARGVNEFKTQIRKILTDIQKSPDRSDSPVFDFLRDEERIVGLNERKTIVRKLKGFLTEVLYHLHFAELVMQGKTTKGHGLNRFSTVAMADLLSTNYVTITEEPDKYLFYLRNCMDLMHGYDKTMDIMLAAGKDPRIINAEGHCANLAERLRTYIIPPTKKALDTISKGIMVDTEPPIVVWDERYRKLLE